MEQNGENVNMGGNIPEAEAVNSAGENIPDTETVNNAGGSIPNTEATNTTTGNNADGATEQNEVFYVVSEQDQTLRLIAFILFVVSTVSSALLIIPLFWMVPICIMTWKTYKGERANTVALGVCSLLFCNMIGGILLLVSKKELES